MTKGLVKYLSLKEWNQLENLPKNERDSLILNLLYETGCTVNELVNIRKSDFGRNSLQIRAENARNHEKRVVYISSTLLKKAQALYRKDSGKYLFSTRQGSSITTKRVRQIVQKYCKLCGLGKAGPQILRYTHIVHAYQKNIPLDAIQKQVGLKRSRAIEIFEQLPELATNDAYKKFID